jgi:hypothetical protein
MFGTGRKTPRCRQAIHFERPISITARHANVASVLLPPSALQFVVERDNVGTQRPQMTHIYQVTRLNTQSHSIMRPSVRIGPTIAAAGGLRLPRRSATATPFRPRSPLAVFSSASAAASWPVHCNGNAQGPAIEVSALPLAPAPLPPTPSASTLVGLMPYLWQLAVGEKHMIWRLSAALALLLT